MSSTTMTSISEMARTSMTKRLFMIFSEFMNRIVMSQMASCSSRNRNDAPLHRLRGSLIMTAANQIEAAARNRLTTTNIDKTLPGHFTRESTQVFLQR